MPKPNFARLNKSLVISLFCCFLLVNGESCEKKYAEKEGKDYLKKLNAEIQVKTTENVLASWAYESNITDENLQHQLEVSAKLANFTKEAWKETIKYPWKTFKDPDTRRQFQKYSVLGTAILSPEKYNQFTKIISDMSSVYGKARVCNYHNQSDCTLQLEPELTEIFVKSRDPNELLYYWQQWRKVSGKPVRKMYKQYVDLSNEAAVLNNFTDNTQFWLKDYEASDFKSQVEDLWQQLRPLYLQLHAYVRRRLREQYGEQHVPKKGPIPAHLLGNMWAQSWGNVFDFTAPYPNKPSMDVTPNMVEQGYTPLRMFKLAEEFFTSLGLSPMPESFWKNSILEKPTDGRDLICHASAWDFYDGKDFRIKQCTRVTMEDLNTVHHEMGHIQYFLQYKNQPLVYKEGTNPGFHEAVGDVMALSVSTPNHLRKIGLLNATDNDHESDINQLYNMALDKIAFLPFGYLMDQWRWNVFEGKITDSNYNCKWWQLREKYQGLSASVTRSEEDFDPGAKYHTVANVPYIRYFVSFVIQFQFHRSLCIAAKQYDPNNPSAKPLYKCDIYQSKEAGALLKKMLQMGSSKPWPDAMEVITGQRKMDARALLEYFESLQKWLEKENKRTNEFIGWESTQRECFYGGQEDIKAGGNLKKQGNYEDENIAYSYAEFVRQDDNSFGFPDYVEETQPPYLSLRHGSKESKFQSDYYPAKNKADRLSNANIFRTYLDKKYLNNLSKLQRLPELNAKFIKHQLLCRAINRRSDNSPDHDNFENQKRALKTEKAKFMNMIWQNFKYSGNKPTNGGRLSRRKSNLRRETQTPKLCRRPHHGDTNCDCKNNRKNKLKSMIIMQPIGDDDESKQENDHKETPKSHDGEDLEGDSEILQLVADLCTRKMSVGEIARKVEKLQQRIEKRLKDTKSQNSCDTNTNDRNNSDAKTKGFSSVSDKPCSKVIIVCLRKGPKKSCKKCNRNSQLLRNKFDFSKNINFHENLENVLQARFNSLKNIAPDKKCIHPKENQVLAIISVEKADAEGENNINSRKKNPGNEYFSHVLFLGKPPKYNIKQKKSYTEYHFQRKFPVLYNAVVITSGGKVEKSDDRTSGKLRRMTRPSDSRKKFGNSVLHKGEKYRGYSQKGLLHSVKYDKHNKNNIVQYFGWLQILL